MNWFMQTMRAITRRPVLALVACTSAVALAGAASAAMAAPAIDGNLDDMITYAQNLQSSGAGAGLFITDKPDVNGDPTPETIYNDAKFIPCPTPTPLIGTHWVNGAEIFRHVLAYTPGSTTLYLGLRTEGFIGDTDGNGNPDNSGGGSCNPDDNIEDTNGISGNELYAWSFDLNCDGTTDGQIKIQDNAIVGTGTLAGVTGTFAFRQGGSGSASGKDLEVQVNLVSPLPPAFKYVRVESNAFDGLSEDRSDGATIIATPKINVLKSAEPISICAGQKTRFTLTVQNTGQTPLAVDMVDHLPAALSYAGNLSSSCGVGAPVANGSDLTFPQFQLDAGASCTVSFDAQSSAQCFGNTVNSVDVIGTFSSLCIKGGSEAVSAHADFTVVCKSLPCVEVTAGGPKNACPGAPIQISGTAKNCSLDPELITVKVGGVQAYSQTVAAGQTANWSYDTVMPADCTHGQNSDFAVEAVGSSECGSDTKSTSVSVRCNDLPCLELTGDVLPKAACAGDALALDGNVKNCSLDAETIVVTVNGAQVFNQVVAGGVTVAWHLDTTMPACTAGSQVPFAVVAKATNDCDANGITKTVDLSVRCKDKPCVQLTGDVNPKSACPGDALTVSGNVKNCSLDPETIVVTINGDQVINEVFQPGQDKDYSKGYVMPQCSAGNSVPFQVVAVATGDCQPADTKTVDLSVACKNPPCVSVTAEANKAAACPNEEVADYTVSVGGVQVYSGSLAPGAEADYSRTVSMGDCVAGNNVTWDVVAHASNTCGNDEDTKQVSVRCKATPCLELTADVNPKSACPGTALLISGTVKNCSIDPETIVVTVNGEQVFNQVVDGGATLNYSKSTTMPACASGDLVPFQVIAKATNDCDQNGITKTADLSVTCKNPPCVEAGAECNPPKACPGTPIAVKGSAKNCSPSAENIVISIEGQTQSFPAVPAGETVSWTRTIVLRECTSGEAVQFNVIATASNDCGEAKPSNASCSVLCQKPQVEVVKSVSPTGPVDQGTTLHYTITVTNPSKDVALDNVKVTDTMCGLTAYANNATPNPTSAPTVGGNGDVVWDVPSIPAGGSATFTFDVTVNTLPNPDCESTSLSCTNSVVVVGNCADAQARATDSVTTPINPCQPKGLCRLTGGGCLNENGDNKGHKQSTFGGNASPEHSGGGPTGNEWEHVYRDGKTILFNWHSHDAHVIECSVVPPGPCSPHAVNTRADFVGTGKYSIGPGGRDQDGNMVAYIIDHREGACNKNNRDEYSIVVRTGLTIGSGDIVFQTSGQIDCGNLQIHETPARLFGSGVSLPTTGTGSLGVAVLNRAYPNPFGGKTNFAYRVGNDGTSVEVGVYNVAGRLVKSLASGAQAAGTYTVTWDGSDNDGVRMAPGVYFLRSHVGEDTVVNRVIYVAR
jgi:uncharacterized repeat protein (TIGR01451 family)